jgi:7,8-dihydropterin-6-yl-methyl-4-(beta-D-ribofuranosyl)aminobenzene 5'-phosphate synthase
MPRSRGVEEQGSRGAEALHLARHSPVSFAAGPGEGEVGMKVSVLMENRPSPSDGRLAFEWGLSLHVALEGRAILFDTGASGRFVDNAEHLSVDLASADVAVLSHHHSDHGGGLRRFFAVNPNAKVYLGKRSDGECWVKVFGVVKRYAGLDRALLAS